MKLKFKKPKSQLDEMQEQNLLSVEKGAFWIAYIGIIIAFVIQCAMGAEPKQVADCWILMMVLSIYVWFRCYKYGIWARYMVPNAKSNLISSLITGFATGLAIFGIGKYFEIPTKENIKFTILFTIGCCIFTYIIGFINLKVYRKRRNKLDEE